MNLEFTINFITIFIIFVTNMSTGLKSSKIKYKNFKSKLKDQAYKSVIERKENYENSDLISPVLFESFITSRKFHLQETFEAYGTISSLLSLAKNGDIVQHGTCESSLKSITGKWSIGDNDILKMNIERTYTKKHLEYKVQSSFLGILKENASNFLFISGIIHDDEINESYKAHSTGNFIMIPTTIESLTSIPHQFYHHLQTILS